MAPAAVVWLRLKPTPTTDLYDVSAVTEPAAQRAEAPNDGEQPVVLHVGEMQVVVLELSPFQVKPYPIRLPDVT